MDKDTEKRYRDLLKSSIRFVKKASEYTIDSMDTQMNKSIYELKLKYSEFLKQTEELDMINQEEKLIAYGAYCFLKHHSDLLDQEFKKVIGSKLFTYAFIRELYKIEPNLINKILTGNLISILNKANENRIIKSNNLNV